MARGHPDSQTRLREAITTQCELLRATVRLYVLRAGLGDDLTAPDIADEIVNEMVVEALRHGDTRYDPARVAQAWLLGIAANLIRRRQAAHARNDRREPLVRSLYADTAETMSDDELFDQFAALATNDTPETHYERDEQINALLAPATAEDRHIIWLAVVCGLNGKLLGKELGISAGAARVRLHRALRRLRVAHGVQMEADQ